MSRYKEFEFLSPSLPFMEYISFGDGGGVETKGAHFRLDQVVWKYGTRMGRHNSSLIKHGWSPKKIPFLFYAYASRTYVRIKGKRSRLLSRHYLAWKSTLAYWRRDLNASRHAAVLLRAASMLIEKHTWTAWRTEELVRITGSIHRKKNCECYREYFDAFLFYADRRFGEVLN